MGQQQGKDIPVDIGQEITCLTNKTIWTVHYGTSKTDSTGVLVFLFDFANKSDDEIRQARAAHLRLKTLRHPGVIRYIDGVELSDCIYMMTEEATPLYEHLQSPESSPNLTSWGIYHTIKTLSFLNNDCSFVHRNVCMSSVFVDSAGEWKLSGVEFMYSFNDTNVPVKNLEALRKYDPPELTKPTRRVEKWSHDMWGLGCLIWEVFNGALTQSTNLKNTSKIPKVLIPHYCELVSSNPLSRPNPSSLLINLRESGQYLSNPFVSLALKVEELQLMESEKKNKFFAELNKSLDLFPDQYAHYKILPHLLNAFEFGGAGPAVLAPLLRIGKILPDDEYQRKIVPCIVRSFGSNDRATRLNLLQQLDHFVDQLQPNVINNQLFTHILTGFTDTVPAIREQTIKSSLLLAPKLNESNLNDQLLKCFAKCQLDEQPGIRTNTTICLGKIAQHLNSKTRSKVLVSAFTRSLKDPFPPARSAGIGALATTISYYSIQDIATRILPALCHMTIDNEKSVREQTFKVVKLFMENLEKNSDVMITQVSEDTGGSTSSSSMVKWAVRSISKYVTSSSAQQQQQQEPTHNDEPTDLHKEEEQDKCEQETWEDNTTLQWNDDYDDDSWEPMTKHTSAPMKLQSKRSTTPEDDFWSALESTNTSSIANRKERTPPPPVPASLFDYSPKESIANDKDGWDDWDDMEFNEQPAKVKTLDIKSTDGDGWDCDDGEWDSIDEPVQTMQQEKAEMTKQEMLQKKREERRLKQEEARKKRSAGMSLKPTGLGAVKKD